MTAIGEIAFANCTSLKDVTLPASLKEICSNLFLNVDYETFEEDGNLPVTVHAPKGSYAERYAKENGLAYIEC